MNRKSNVISALRSTRQSLKPIRRQNIASKSFSEISNDPFTSQGNSAVTQRLMLLKYLTTKFFISFLNGPIPASFVYFRYFLDTISIIQTEKSLHGVLGIRTWGRRMVGADVTMELWWPPHLTTKLINQYKQLMPFDCAYLMKLSVYKFALDKLLD